MKRYELISSLAWVAVGVLFCIGSFRLGLGGLGEPGPGFFPFLMSVCLISFSLIHLSSSIKKSGQFNFDVSKRFWPERDGIKRILFTIMSLSVFVIVLNYIGFTLTAFLFIFFLLRFIEPQKWLTVFSITILSTGLSYIIFQLWLKANLPAGPLGF
jgi:putative tricarboxylic transport membrane protein